MRLFLISVLTVCFFAQIHALPGKLPFHTTFNGDIYLIKAGDGSGIINHSNMMDYYLRALNLDYQMLCERSGNNGVDNENGQTHDIERCYEGNLYRIVYRCRSQLLELQLLGIKRNGKCALDNDEINMSVNGMPENTVGWNGKTKKNFDEIDKTPASFGHLNQLI